MITFLLVTIALLTTFVMITFLLVVIALLAIFVMIGVFVAYQVAKKQKPPADESNRLGHIALVWEACTAPHRFAEFRPYLKYDVSEWADIIRGINNAD